MLNKALAYRAKMWRTFTETDLDFSCDLCRTRSYELRETDVGTVCLACWLEWPECDQCGVGTAQFELRGDLVCKDCFLPEPTSDYLEEQREAYTNRRRERTWYTVPPKGEDS